MNMRIETGKNASVKGTDDIAPASRRRIGGRFGLRGIITKNYAFIFILPGLIGFIIFFIWPFIVSLGYTVVDKPVNGSFVGIDNFVSLFQNKPYLQGLKNTLIFMLICIPLNMALSLFTALCINKVKRFRELFTLIFLIPLVIPSGSMAFFWKMLFSYNGYLNNFLGSFGIAKVNWIESEYAIFVIVLIFIWKNLGYNMVLFMAGLNGIPKEYYESAKVDGAGAWNIFRKITMPCLWPSFVLVLIMSIINSFKVFKEIYLLTGNYPHESIYTLQHFMNNMFNSLNYTRLATATSVLVLGITILTQVLLRIERRATNGTY